MFDKSIELEGKVLKKITWQNKKYWSLLQRKKVERVLLSSSFTVRRVLKELTGLCEEFVRNKVFRVFFPLHFLSWMLFMQDYAIKLTEVFYLVRFYLLNGRIHCIGCFCSTLGHKHHQVYAVKCAVSVHAIELKFRHTFLF